MSVIQAYFNGKKSAVSGPTVDDVNRQIAEIERDYGMSAFGSYTLYELDSFEDAPNEEHLLKV